MSKMDVHFSSESDEWETPQDLFDELNNEFHFYADMACTHENKKCVVYSTNSLQNSWNYLVKYAFSDYNPNGYVWCNPPYSRGKLKAFLEKGHEAMLEGTKSVFLIPARTDTKAWHDYIWDKENHKPREGVEVRFIKGRLKFEKDGKPVLDRNGKQQSAPFPSAIIIFRGKVGV